MKTISEEELQLKVTCKFFTALLEGKQTASTAMHSNSNYRLINTDTVTATKKENGGVMLTIEKKRRENGADSGEVLCKDGGNLERKKECRSRGEKRNSQGKKGKRKSHPQWERERKKRGAVLALLNFFYNHKYLIIIIIIKYKIISNFCQPQL